MKIKRLSIFSHLLACAILFVPLSADAVVNWTKDSRNPILKRGIPPSWEQGDLERPVVIKDGATYKMWYTGNDASAVLRIGYATSPDGTTWTKYNDPSTTGDPYANSDPVLQPSDGANWDSTHVGFAWILKDGAKYKMWYAGASTEDPDDSAQIGYAESDDGISWSRSGLNPLNLTGGATDWDAGVYGPCVIKDDDAPASERYKMWYVGYNLNPPGHPPSIGYATSSDGTTWTKYNDPSTTDDPYVNSDPVIQVGNWGPYDGSWDEEDVDAVTVLKDGVQTVVGDPFSAVEQNLNRDVQFALFVEKGLLGLAAVAFDDVAYQIADCLPFRVYV